MSRSTLFGRFCWLAAAKRAKLCVEYELRHPDAGKATAMISQTAEYALRAIVFLAQQEHPKTTAAIAEATEVPAGYLSKVMQGLSRAKLVHSQRGIHGGFVLAVDAETLTVLQVISAVDPIRRFHECPLGLHGKNLCPLHSKLNDAAMLVEETFADTTIADLNDVPKTRKPLCTFPLEKQ